MVDDPFAKYSAAPPQSAELSAAGGEDPFAKYARAPEGEQPPPEEKEVGAGSSALRGAKQAFLLGYGPQVSAALSTGHMPGSSDPEYAKAVEAEKAANEAAWKQHPYAYGAGMVGAAVPAAVAQLFAAPEEAAVAGGLGAGELLANSGSIAGLAGTGVRAIAGAGEGIAPTLARGTAAALESPVTQGAIYGSSTGDTATEKLKGAAEGAAFAKLLPGLVSGAAGMAGDVFAGAVTKPLSRLVSGDPTTAEVVGNAAKNIENLTGATLETPAAAASNGLVTTLATKADPFSQAANKAAGHSGTIDSVIGNIVGDNPPDSQAAGKAIQNSFYNDYIVGSGPNSFRSQMDKIYAPVQALEGSQSKFAPENLLDAIDSLRTGDEYKINPKGIDNAIGTIQDGLKASPDGMSLGYMRKLRQFISDRMDFNNLNGVDADQKTMSALRNALSQDMQATADKIAGPDAAKSLAFQRAEAQASDLYNQKDKLIDSLGNIKPGAAGATTPAETFSTLSGMAGLRRAGNVAALEDIKNTVSPDAWNTFQRAYLNQMSPSGRFSYGNFNKQYSQMSNKAKDLVFGQVGDGGVRDIMENISTIGRHVGPKIDKLTSQAGGISGLQTLEGVATFGAPRRALTAMTAATALGRVGARNITAALPPPSVMSNISRSIQNNPQAQSIISSLQSKMVNPVLSGTKSGQQVLQNALNKSSAALSAQLGVTITPAILNALIVGGGHVVRHFTGHAAGGRIGRKSGGAVKNDAKAEAHRLIALSEKIKKKQAQQTEPLLNLDDTTVAKALAIANRGI